LNIRYRQSWVEIDAQALRHNAGQFRRIIGADRKLMAVVKSNAYGHGLLEAAATFISAGADWLGVFEIDEAVALSDAGIKIPILILGNEDEDSTREAIRRGYKITVPSKDAAELVSKTARKLHRQADVHIKIETGTNRQGVRDTEAAKIVSCLSGDLCVNIEGAYTHFANIEDTTDHSYAYFQLRQFNKAVEEMGKAGAKPPIRHTACTAATILFPETFFEMVRTGIGLYGLWPSKETRVSATQYTDTAVDLRPAMTWKTRIIQVKDVPAGEFIGYGCTFRATRNMKIAVLPVGYSNGYDRKFSNSAYVLVRGHRATVTGRVCMNLVMVDITDIHGASVGDEAVLLGRQDGDSITADQLASLAGTINYEIVTRIDPMAQRKLVE